MLMFWFTPESSGVAESAGPVHLPVTHPLPACTFPPYRPHAIYNRKTQLFNKEVEIIGTAIHACDNSSEVQRFRPEHLGSHLCLPRGNFVFVSPFDLSWATVAMSGYHYLDLEDFRRSQPERNVANRTRRDSPARACRRSVLVRTPRMAPRIRHPSPHKATRQHQPKPERH